MSSDLVGRIAEALLNEFRRRAGVPPTTMGEMLPEHADEWRMDAIAALKALREPTWSAQIAGRDVMLAEDPGLDLSTDDARACWVAMIDHEIKLAEGGDDE